MERQKKRGSASDSTLIGYSKTICYFDDAQDAGTDEPDHPDTRSKFLERLSIAGSKLN